MLGNVPGPDEQNLFIYPWLKNQEFAGTINGTNKDFTFPAGKTAVNVSECDTVMLADKFVENATGGDTPYYKYSGSWTLTRGSVSGFDAKVYFRKNGIDTYVDGATVTFTGAGITFTQAPTAAIADKIIVHFPAITTATPEQTDFYIKEYNPKYNGRDFEVVNYIGGKTVKRRKPLELTEISITAAKTGNYIASLILGGVVNYTVGTKLIKNVTGNTDTNPILVKVKVIDPDAPNKYLIGIYRDGGVTGNDTKGGADADLDESFTVKCAPQDTIELDITA